MEKNEFYIGEMLEVKANNIEEALNKKKNSSQL